MAECIRYVCGHCGKDITAWSDGNPYYIDEHGQKQYAYHPNHELLERCIGNDSPHLCLSCGNEFKVDSREPVSACPSCEADGFVGTSQLGGQRCPYCKTGFFSADPDFHCIS